MTIQKTKNTPHKAAIAVVTLAVIAISSPAQVVFSDDFETPDVEPGYDVKKTSQKVNQAKWVPSSVGYNSQHGGIVDERENSGANFTDPVGSQAYGTRYTNSGATSVKGLIGSLKSGVTYTVSFDVVVDGWNGGAAYHVGLVTFAPDADRANTSFDGMSVDTSTVLAASKGAASGASYETKAFSYTADGTENTLGQDLAVRIVGFTNSANIDNISVTTNGGGINVGADGGKPNTFSDWISNYPGVDGLNSFNEDPDGDGIVNGVENLFGTTPDKVTDGLVANEPRERAKNQFTFTHPENPTPASDLSTPVYQWSKDQKNFHSSGEKTGHTTIVFKREPNTPSAGITTVTGIVTGPVPDKIFVNIAVSLKP